MDFLRDLTKRRDGTYGKLSSVDPTGKNIDIWRIAPGETVTLAELDGPGCITHFWFAPFSRESKEASIIEPELFNQVCWASDVWPVMGVLWDFSDPNLYRNSTLKITWEDNEYPSVLTPLGDFFGVCNGQPSRYTSMPFSVNLPDRFSLMYGGPAGMNSYFPMPFNKKAKFEVTNEGEYTLCLIWHIDFELKEKPQEDILYFHASWRRELACKGWAPEIPANFIELHDIADTEGKDNFVILETEGEGHYVGCNLQAIMREPEMGVGWSEGNDMIYIDGETLPSIVGTGGEDYFCQGWGVQPGAYQNFAGCIISEELMPGINCVYRFHIPDPVTFKKSIKVSMQHGHANHLSDDWAATAYWYGTLPKKPMTLPPMEVRLPGKVEQRPAPDVDISTLSPEQAAAKKAYHERKTKFFTDKAAVREKQYALTRNAEKAVPQTAAAFRKRADKK